ncbi:uncharacterized protein LOC143630645 [Bidens hawaiensis]|uniref:uncharacterized protein LOC143630645 n=1 Tax=Bidens hawaiensis TaxID=980011 RepID=UPI00404ADAC9
MSGQPSRPWFRLATMVRPPPPPPPAPAPTPAAPATQPNQGPSPPRPTFIRPAFSTTAIPPPQQLTQTPPPQQPNPTLSPPRPTPPLAPTTNVVGPPASPPPPPRQSRDPNPSPPSSPSSPPKIIRLAEKTSPPLSPLVLPSALKQKPYNHESPPEYRQKAMIVQETKENPKNSSNGRHMTTRKPETHKKQDDASMKNTITIAGDNKGAIMNITPFSKTPESGNIINKSSNGESTSGKNKNSNPSLLKHSFHNSNVQGVNNSMLFNYTISHHDPGIHLTLSTKLDHGHATIHSKE